MEKEILSLNYKDLESASARYSFQTIPENFETYESYYRTFEPLLFMEILEKLKIAKDECEEYPIELSFSSHQSIDEFLDANWTFKKECFDLQVNDLVVVSPKNCRCSGGDSGEKWKGLEHRSVYAFGKVTKLDKKKDMLTIRFHFGNVQRTRYLQSSFRTQASFYVFRVANLITFQRDFTALKGLEKYTLRSEILKPAAPVLKAGELNESVVSFLTKESFNAPQIDAITKCARMERGISLLQGPPGTGKTRTVLGILGIVLKKNNGASVKTPHCGIPESLNIIVPTSKLPKSQILLCAPSNAAVDELVLRVKSGVHTPHGVVKPKVVRIVGTNSNLDKRLIEVTLDELVSAELNGTDNENGDLGKKRLKLTESFRELRADHMKAKDAIENKREAEKIAREKNDTEDVRKLSKDMDSLKKHKHVIENKMSLIKNQLSRFDKDIESRKKKAEQTVLQNADIICCTLSGSGHETLMANAHSFDYIIIDEAAQCVELEVLIPLKYECDKIILIGDPNQLPATVFSKEVKKYNYEQSFV